MLAPHDSHNLQRFIDAQEPVISRVLAELREGAKQSHWMWYIFPQIAGLGSSQAARYYAIASMEEAKAYLEHPVLGERLRRCCRLLLDHAGASAVDILGSIDSIKLRSSMTLFAAASRDPIFSAVLDEFYNGQADTLTLDTLRQPRQ